MREAVQGERRGKVLELGLEQGWKKLLIQEEKTVPTHPPRHVEAVNLCTECPIQIELIRELSGE
jgi:hypothetical protein